ncbi:hypothetical protein HPB50_018215 [Hyalomma asiaticum]|uniref:Uncharacterized protein n=1 Tax=Hyalomma asiaticum TaxID=266040 RepID=A0ACB7T597_HYAAI|nr:hypothetical protein HPB50_018215 [Hyalomma asiaticum]
MATKGPRVSMTQRDILIQFIEQHPYLARAMTSLSLRLSAARKKELWDEVAGVLNQRGPAVKTSECWRNHWLKLVHAACREAARSATERTSAGGGKVGGVDGRILDVCRRPAPWSRTPPNFLRIPTSHQRSPSHHHSRCQSPSRGRHHSLELRSCTIGN